MVHVNAIAKNAADDKLRQSLRRFAHTYPAPATVVLISGDVNFSMELNDLIHLHNITVVLVHNLQASDALKVFANRLVIYDDFIKDVIPPSKQTVLQFSLFTFFFCFFLLFFFFGGGGGVGELISSSNRIELLNE